MIWKLAWRNVWRNKRRSYITIASIFFAVFFATVQRSFQLGTYDHMIETVVRPTTGYGQIHAAGYWDEPSLDNVFAFSDSLQLALTRFLKPEQLHPRVEGYALAAGKTNTKGIQVIGLDLDAENQILEIDDKLIAGTIPSEGSILIGSGVADFLEVNIGDSIVLLGQGHYGSSAAGIYPVAGIVKFPSPQVDNSLLYIPLKSGQAFFAMDGLVSTVIIDANSPAQAAETIHLLEEFLPEETYEVMFWEELLPEIVQAIQADNISGLIMTGILYMVVVFGIFGTVLMMTNERQYEFGVSVAIGVHRHKLARMVMFEVAILALIAVIVGGLVSYPIMYYFYENPIALTGEAAHSVEQYGWDPLMPTSKSLSIPLYNSVFILLISIILSLYPAISILSLQPIKAMRKA